jgi:2-methylcitrate dehydratase PrpD
LSNLRPYSAKQNSIDGARGTRHNKEKWKEKKNKKKKIKLGANNRSQ